MQGNIHQLQKEHQDRLQGRTMYRVQGMQEVQPKGRFP